MTLPKKRIIPDEFSTKVAPLGILFPTIEPLFSSPPNEQEKLKFVQEHQSTYFPQYQELAQTFVDHINYISFKEFLTTFLTQVNYFKEKIGDKPYVVWISQKKKEMCMGLMMYLRRDAVNFG